MTWGNQHFEIHKTKASFQNKKSIKLTTFPEDLITQPTDIGPTHGTDSSNETARTPKTMLALGTTAYSVAQNATKALSIIHHNKIAHMPHNKKHIYKTIHKSNIQECTRVEHECHVRNYVRTTTQNNTRFLRHTPSVQPFYVQLFMLNLFTYNILPYAISCTTFLQPPRVPQFLDHCKR